MKTAGIAHASDGTPVYMWWFKAKDIPKYDLAFQKVGLAVFVHLHVDLNLSWRSASLVIFQIPSCKLARLFRRGQAS